MPYQKNLKHFLRYILIILVIGALLFYGWYRARDFLAGPTIEILSPTNGSATSTNIIAIQGATKNISDISLNSRKIFTDKEGHFSETVVLFTGYNIITLNASDRFGRSTHKELEISVRK